MRVLLVEDHAPLARALQLGLRQQGYTVDVAATLEDARYALSISSYDIVVLDLRLPDGHGFTLCRWLRARDEHLPILILTALDRPEDIIEGLDAGADDYVVKPVELPVLAARIRALLRRAAPNPQPVLEWRGLRLDPASRQAWLNGEPLHLTTRQFALLEYLMRHPGRVISAEELLEHIWGAEADPFTNTIRVHIHLLRRKLGDDPKHPRFIQTLPGAGYRFAPPEEESHA